MSTRGLRTGIFAALLAALAIGGPACGPAKRPPAQRLPMELLNRHKRKPKVTSTTGTLDGVVLGPDGKPVDFALVTAVSLSDDPEDGKRPFSATTINHGKFEIADVPPGNYGLTVTGPEANVAVRPGATPLPGAVGAPIVTGTYAGVVTVTAGEPGVPMLMRLGTTGALFTGHVMDDGGKPIVDALVRAVRESPYEGDHFFAKTDADGKFTLAVPEGHYFLIGSADGRRPQRLQFVPDKVPPDILFRLLPALPPPSKEELTEWIQSTGGAIASPDSAILTDLAKLRDIVGTARIVGLGDASYTSSEGWKIRTRMVRSLIADAGFSGVLLEATQADVRALDEHVRYGKGKLAEVLHGLGYFSLDTQEAAALFAWMRHYNEDKKHRTKLGVYGIDVQRTQIAATELLAFLQKVDKVLAPTVQTTLERLRVNDYGLDLRRRPDEEQQQVTADLEVIASRFEKREPLYVGQTSERTVSLAREDLESLRWAVKVYLDEAQRGPALAALAKRRVDQGPKSMRYVLLAHDAFVSKRKEDAGTGAALAAAYKNDYVAIGGTFYQGWLRAWDFTQGATTERGVKLFRLPPAEPGTLEGTLDLAGMPLFFADVRKAKGAVLAWMDARLAMRSIGTVFAGERRARTRTVAMDAFDALYFVRKQTSVTLTETGARPGGKEWE
ncbi:MAG: erythromycin esterase family protein [Polyangiaceae bacterium]